MTPVLVLALSILAGGGAVRNAHAFPNAIKASLSISDSETESLSIVDAAGTDRFLFLVTTSPSSLVVIDLMGFFVRDRLSLAKTPAHLAVRKDGQRVYVCFTDNSITSYSVSVSNEAALEAANDISIAELSPTPASFVDMAAIPTVQEGRELIAFLTTDNDNAKSEETLFFFNMLTDSWLDTNTSAAQVNGASLNSLAGGVAGLTPHTILVSTAESGQAANEFFVFYTQSDDSSVNFVGVRLSDFETSSGGAVRVSTDSGQTFGRAVLAPDGSYLLIALDRASTRTLLARYENTTDSGNNELIFLGGSGQRLPIGVGTLGLVHMPVLRPAASTPSPYLYLVTAISGSSEESELYRERTLSLFSSDQLSVTSTVATPLTGDALSADQLRFPSSRELWLRGAADNYLYAVELGGNEIGIVTDNPWITLIDYSPGRLSNADTLSFTFRSDRSGTYQVRSQVSEAASLKVAFDTGSVVASGSLTEDAPITVEVPVSALNLGSEEGDRRIFLTVDSEGAVGRLAVPFVFDNVPETPRNFSLGFGNESVYVFFSPVAASDLLRYEVEFATDPTYEDNFRGESFEGVVSPWLLPVSDYGTDDISVIIGGVPNGTPLYVRVRAVDSSGKSSPWTGVLSETPEATVGLIAKTGDEGGWACSVAGRGDTRNLFWLLLVPLMLLAQKPRSPLRRRGDQ